MPAPAARPEIVNIGTIRANFNPKKVTIVISITIGAKRSTFANYYLKKTAPTGLGA